jgi:predicted TIM-barrel fold metal-dependent hydrolase
LRLGRIAEKFPDGQFLMVHMGGVSHPPLATAAIEAAQAHPNIHVIASGVYEIAVMQAIQRLGAERLSFGSDTPFRLMHVQLAFYRALLEPFDERTREFVLGANIVRVLGADGFPRH